MTRDDIIRLAREAGLTVCRDEWVFGEMLARFAALVEQHLISQGYRQCAKGQRTTQHCALLEMHTKECHSSADD